MRIVAVSPHPDDLEYGCGGILARAAENNHEVTMVCCKTSLSELGDELDTKTAETREEEARRAAGVLNCKVEFVKCDPINIPSDSRRNIVKVIRTIQPDILIANDPNDYHPHHKRTSRIVMEACFIAQLPNAKTTEAPWQTAQVFYYEAFSSLSFLPDYYVDVTTLFVKARKALLEHKTGLSVLPVLSHKMNAIRLVHGSHCGTLYAEGLRIVRGFWFDTIKARQIGLHFLSELNSRSLH